MSAQAVESEEKRYFVDTNVFLRFLTNDHPAQANAVRRMLQRAATGDILLQTSALVIAEIVWTLESYYQLSRQEVKAKVLAMVNTPGLAVEHADLVLQAAILYAEKNVDFIDAYNAYWMKRHAITHAYTFDVKHFSRAEGIRPFQPG